jgi:hypothetical protein
MMRRHLLPWICLLSLLQACSSYAPPDALAGISREALVARMGPPDMERRTDTGTRLEFPRGPFGKHTWFIYFDAQGRAIRSEQVLTEQNFSRVEAGMAQDDVRRLLGRPGEIQGLARSRGEVWSYRYENPFCNWFQVELSLQGQVRSTGHGPAPECEVRDEILLLHH